MENKGKTAADDAIVDIDHTCRIFDLFLFKNSPFFRKPKTAAELVEPAVKGTENVLAACAGASSVRRLVVTGSFASMIFAFDHTKTPERAYCEDDWNAISTADHPEPMHWYRASKILAERACWDYVEKNKPHFDIAVINPPMIIGPWLPGYARPNESSMILKEFLTGRRRGCRGFEGKAGSGDGERDKWGK